MTTNFINDSMAKLLKADTGQMVICLTDGRILTVEQRLLLSFTPLLIKL